MENSFMVKKKYIFILVALILLPIFNRLTAEEEKPQGMPPAKVVVSAVAGGMVAPQSEFVGTVYYQEVSDVATEVRGKVESVTFEEGQKVTRGKILARLSSDLLEKSLQAARANHEQIMADLEKAGRDLSRAENLFETQLITEQLYDERRYGVSSLEKKAVSIKADVERIEVELEKKSVTAPFDGVVIKRHVDRGEWLNEGATVATIAMEKVVDIVAEVSGSMLGYIKKGMEVTVIVGGETMTGRVIAIIPRGDISTRTFPIKIRVKNSLSLVEGMEARVTLPTGIKEKALIVPRDAVITSFGNDVVYAVDDSQARMIVVTVIGYEGMTVGVRGEGLAEGMNVVVKGNERLRPGQSVMIQ